MKKATFLGTALLLVTGLLAGCSGTQQAQLNAFNAAKAKSEANKTLVRRYYDIINAKNWDAMDQVWTSNYKRYPSATAAATGPALDAAGQKKRMAGLGAAFPDFKITIYDMVAEGDLVGVRADVQGTHQGTFQGIPPTGKTFRIYETAFFRIENGKIAEHWGSPDMFDVLQQIGAVVSAGK